MRSLSSRRGQRGSNDESCWLQSLRSVLFSKPWVLSCACLISILGLMRSVQDENARILSFKASNSAYSNDAYASTVSKALTSLSQISHNDQQQKGQQCHTFGKYGGPISLVWAWHDPPIASAFKTTVESIIANETTENVQIDIYCGSTECIAMAQAAARENPCVNVQFMVIPTLAQTTPLEEWAGDHLLAKLLHANHFEETLQIAMQLVVLWKHGGMVMVPGSVLTDEFFHNLTIEPSNTFVVHQENDSLMKPSAGMYAAIATSSHPVVRAMMESILELSSWPNYRPDVWPVQVDWKQMLAQLMDGVFSEDVKIENLIDFSVANQPLFLEKKRHFGSLTYQSRRSHLKSLGNMGMNRGDEMQGLGGMQFLPRLDAFVERDRLDVVSVIGSSEFISSSDPVTPTTLPRPATIPTTVFLNAWYGTPDMVWPPPGKIEPILVAMHLNNQKVKDKFAKSTEYLSKHWPIGARDTSTEAFFQSVGVHALFSACMTMTLRPTISYDRLTLSRTDDDILIVDITDQGLDILPKHVKMAAKTLTAKVTDETMVDDQLGRYVLAHEMKMSLQKARLVVTQRLHVALPAASMGTPVILILDNALPGGGGANGNSRFSGLQAAVHTINIHSESAKQEALEFLDNFQWDNPPANPSPETIMIRRNALSVLTMCHGQDLFDSGRKFGVIPSEWKYPSEQSACSEAAADEDVIHIASALDPEWLDSQPIFPSWINSLYKSNREKKFAFYFLTHDMTDKERCLVRWIVSQYFPNSQVYTISTDHMLGNLPYKGLKHVPLVTQSRLFLDKLLPCVDHVLWIDGDAFVVGDIEELWQQRLDLSDCGIAGRTSFLPNVVGGMLLQHMSIKDGKKVWEKAAGDDSGFNAGVLLLSLNRFRETKFVENVASYWAFELGGNDQIALNMQCNGTYTNLDPTWNVFQHYPEDPVNGKPTEWKIVHMQGSKKPWDVSDVSLQDYVWKDVHLSLVDALLGPNK
ncbi:glycosyl transferase family 8 protein [Nitzschia inconspicua]|uniref:Glycosyl transferase family 8 protein n=1 Tax=Nitzschia inconspicua TaxID=303405 RepID=A0A9K3PU30_9STRA|nr:glycosyl transferase family 8 protein [Nitzschia inconspicua]KAG7359396.1 glycosyl transferase family 8 protein [Nitzschia inconspicua]